MERNYSEPEEVEINTDIVVIYHAHCHDGFGAAWAAWKKFGNTATYIPAKQGSMYPDGLEDKEVYIVDFSYNEELLEEIEQIARRLVVIDHHISAEPYVRERKEFVFALDKSGAYLAWEYFHPNEEVPLFIQHLSENDIYVYTLPNAELLSVYLLNTPLTFEDFDALRAEIEDPITRERAIEKARLLQEYRENIIDAASRAIDWVRLGGRIIPAVNGYFPVIRSELLHRIYEEHPPVSLSYRFHKGEWRCSIRSNGDFDCSALAAEFGGGGHKGSAGFSIPAPDGRFPFELVDPDEMT